MEDEKDKMVSKIQSEIMNSIQNIYQTAEKIEKVDKERANWILSKVESLRKGVKNKDVEALEVLSELMSLQREIIIFLDTPLYRQTTMELEKKREVKEQTSAVYQDQRKDMLQIYTPQKKNFLEKIIEKIEEKIQKKDKTQLSAEPENTPTINEIANIVAGRYSLEDKDGFVEDFRYIVYENLQDIDRRLLGLKQGEMVRLNEDETYIKNKKNNFLELYTDGRYVSLPTTITGDKKGISMEEFGKVLAFAEFLDGTGESKFKIELLRILRGFENKSVFDLSDSDWEKTKKIFKQELDNSQFYSVYRNMYSQAMEEYNLTSLDFYNQRYEAKRRHKNNVRNQVKIDVNEHQDIPEDKNLQRNDDTKIQADEDYGEPEVHY